MEIPRTIQAAIEHHQAGRLAEAAALYRQVLAIDADHFDALHLLGVLADQSGNHRQAVELISKAVEREPAAFPAFNNLGLAHKALNNLDEACRAFEQAVALKPDYVEALGNLAFAYQAQGKLAEAMPLFRKVVALRPDSAEAHNNLGAVLQAQGKIDEAKACCQKAFAIRPDFAEAVLNLARLAEQQGKHGEALARYRDAVRIKPRWPEAQLCLGSELQAQGFLDEALACFDAALSLDPEYVEARWAQAMSQIPLVYDAGDDPERFRASFADSLGKLDRWFDERRSGEGYKVVGNQGPYYLAYQERDNRAIISAYGDLCARLMQRWRDDQGIDPINGAPQGPIRLGIVSAHIRDHAVWTAITRGWCQSLDRERFSLSLFHLGSVEDHETILARSRAHRFFGGFRDLRHATDTIVAQQLDAIIYPEIGMDPMTTKLASMRLAPVQIAAWGTPETTGLPTIDYYLSAEDFEPADGQRYYRERLVPLPHLGCAYQRLGVTPAHVDLAALRIDASLPLLICPGSAYKYAPEHDRVLVDIARGLGRCQLVFFTDQQANLSEKMKRRITGAFDEAGLDFREHAAFVPWLSRAAFFGLLAQADVCLDTIGFSGFNTVMQAIESGLPLVTMEGRFLRGRFGSGILNRLGLSELVAKCDTEYAQLAVKLGNDPAYRSEVRRRIETSREILFDDVAPVKALETCLLDVTHGSLR